MPIIAPPNPETRKITSLVTDLEQRMRRAEAGLRAAQLRNASITDGGLRIYDDNGAIRTVLGKQGDGTYTAISTNNPNPPPVPAAPQALPALASAIIRHTGETANGSSWPADLKNLNIYYTEAQNPDDWKPGGSLGTSWPEELPIAPLEYTAYLVCVTSVNHSGKESEKSEPVSVEPRQVVPNDLIADIFTGLELSAGVVTEAALAAKAVTATKIADNAIETPMVTAGAIRGFHIAADQIDGGKLIAQAITAREIAALAVIAGKIDVNAVTAGTIAAGAITAIKLDANLVIASRIIAGSQSGNRVELHPTLGLQAYTNGGVLRSFWIDAATGSGFFMGQVATAGSGERIVMNPGGNNPNRIQLWATSNAFAYLDAFSEGTTAAGMTMQASGGDVRRVGTVWVRQGFAQLGIADSSLRAGSQFYAEENFVRCRSATVDLIIDQAITPLGGDRRVAFINYDASGRPMGSGHLNYQHAGDQRPWLVGINQLSGLKFDAESLTVTGGNSMEFGPISASAFRVQSSEEMKDGIGPIRLSGGKTPRDIVKAVPSRQWRYKEAAAPDCNSTLEVRRSARRKHMFPLAEDLQRLDPSLVVEASDGSLTVDLRDVIGLLWETVRQLIEERDG